MAKNEEEQKENLYIKILNLRLAFNEAGLEKVIYWNKLLKRQETEDIGKIQTSLENFLSMLDEGIVSIDIIDKSLNDFLTIRDIKLTDNKRISSMTILKVFNIEELEYQLDEFNSNFDIGQDIEIFYEEYIRKLYTKALSSNIEGNYDYEDLNVEEAFEILLRMENTKPGSLTEYHIKCIHEDVIKNKEKFLNKYKRFQKSPIKTLKKFIPKLIEIKNVKYFSIKDGI
jgi:hypothetical protein